MVSVNTNKAALVALQNLNRTTTNLSGVQERISTGLKVGGAKDNAAVWAIAESQRADTSSLNAVKNSLNRAQSLVDVALAAGGSITDILKEMRELAIAAADPSATTATRLAYNDDFQVKLTSIQQFALSATFDGVNLLDGSLTADLQFLADSDATANTIRLTPQNMTTGAAPGLALAALTLTGANDTNARAALTALDVALPRVTAALSVVGAQAKHIEAHLSFVSKLSDSLETGVGKLVDADLAKESARLQALQVQQQLGTQALSIANQAPQVVLSLFQN